MRAKTSILIILSLLSILLSGCWDRVELNRLAIVLGSAIDKAPGVEEKFMVTAELVNPPQVVTPLVGGGGGDDPDSWILTSTGWTVFDAVRNFIMQSQNKLFWSHSEVLIIGEDLAREGIAPILDFYLRDHELRRTTWFIIAKETTAKEILGVQHKFGGVTSTVIDNLVQSAIVTSNAVQVRITDFTAMLACSQCDPVAGRVEFVAAGEPEGKLEGSETRDMKNNVTEGEFLRYTGAAVFKGDKLVGWLDRKETRGYNWVKGEVQSGIIVVESPEEDGKKVSLEIIKATSNVSVEFKEEMPEFKIEVDVAGNLGETMGKVDLTAKSLLTSLESRMAEVVRNEIEASLQKLQELKADSMGLGLQAYRQQYKDWVKIKDRWEDIYPQLSPEIVVTVSLNRSGLIRTPVNSLSEEE